MIKMEPVESSNIKAIGYEDGIMHVQFTGGATYKYEATPMFYQSLMSAESKGKFLRASGAKGVKI